MMAVSGKRYQRHGSDTMKAWRHMPMIQCDDLYDVIPYGCVPVAVDIIEGAVSLVEYEHPERAFYVFGPEDGTLGGMTTCWCRDVVYVPTHACMNLAATVNVVLYDRMAKQMRKRATL
jgi:tRNA(Leu) C34 or U34 (ribose-2'-O)-methylase TrmL